jgi:hypothetical protein
VSTVCVTSNLACTAASHADGLMWAAAIGVLIAAVTWLATGHLTRALIGVLPFRIELRTRQDRCQACGYLYNSLGHTVSCVLNPRTTS